MTPLESSPEPCLEIMALREPPQVPLLAGELCGEERPHDLVRKPRADHPRAETEHVHVVVLDGLMRRVAVVADRGADARKFIGGNRHAGSAAADDHASVDLTLAKHNGHGLGVVGVIHGSGAMRAEIENYVARLGQRGRQIPFHLVAGVVGSKSDSHERYHTSSRSKGKGQRAKVKGQRSKVKGKVRSKVTSHRSQVKA